MLLLIITCQSNESLNSIHIKLFQNHLFFKSYLTSSNINRLLWWCKTSCVWNIILNKQVRELFVSIICRDVSLLWVIANKISSWFCLYTIYSTWITFGYFSYTITFSKIITQWVQVCYTLHIVLWRILHELFKYKTCNLQQEYEASDFIWEWANDIRYTTMKYERIHRKDSS